MGAAEHQTTTAVRQQLDTRKQLGWSGEQQATASWHRIRRDDDDEWYKAHNVVLLPAGNSLKCLRIQQTPKLNYDL